VTRAAKPPSTAGIPRRGRPALVDTPTTKPHNRGLVQAGAGRHLFRPFSQKRTKSAACSAPRRRAATSRAPTRTRPRVTARPLGASCSESRAVRDLVVYSIEVRYKRDLRKRPGPRMSHQCSFALQPRPSIVNSRRHPAQQSLAISAPRRSLGSLTTIRSNATIGGTLTHGAPQWGGSSRFIKGDTKNGRAVQPTSELAPPPGRLDSTARLESRSGVAAGSCGVAIVGGR